MALEFKKAKREQAKLRIALSAISGGGKTVGSLLIAYGLVKAENPSWSDDQVWESICIVDTENSSGSLYVGSTMGGTKIGAYNTIDIEPPFSTEKYIEAIRLAEQNGQECIIVDSMSHVWNSTGGALERQQQISQRTGNSYTAWAPVKKEMKEMMDAILQSKAHVISCFRAKQEYVQEKNDKGKTVVRNVGLGLVFMDGSEYEYTVHFSLDQEHNAFGQKDRTGIFQGKFEIITPDTGAKLAAWLRGSADAPKAVPPAMHIAAKKAPAPQDGEALEAIRRNVDEAIRRAVEHGDKKAIFARIKEIAGVVNYMKVDDPEILCTLYDEFKGA